MDVYLESGKLTDVMIGRYDYTGADCQYVVTYGDRSYTDPETTPDTVPQEPAVTEEESHLWVYCCITGAVILLGIGVVGFALSKQRKKTRKGKG